MGFCVPHLLKAKLWPSRPVAGLLFGILLLPCTLSLLLMHQVTRVVFFFCFLLHNFLSDTGNISTFCGNGWTRVGDRCFIYQGDPRNYNGSVTEPVFCKLFSCFGP